MALEDHGDLVRIAAVIGVGRRSHMRRSAPTVILVDAGELANWATGSDHDEGWVPALTRSTTAGRHGRRTCHNGMFPCRPRAAGASARARMRAVRVARGSMTTSTAPTDSARS